MKKYIKYLLALVIFSVLIYFIGFENIIDSFTHFKIIYIPLMIIFFIMSLMLEALSLYFIILPFRKVRLLKLFKYSSVVDAFGLFLPGKINTFAYPLFLKRENLTNSQSILVVVLIKSTMVVLTALSVIVGSFFLSINNVVNLSAIIILFIMVLTFMLLFAERFRSFIKKYILRRYSVFFTGFKKDYTSYFKKYSAYLLYNLFLSFLKLVSGVLIYYMLFLGFGQNAPFIKVFYIYCIITIITWLPISVIGVGVNESLGVIFYGLIGIGPAAVFSSYIIFNIIVYIYGILVLNLLLTKIDRNLFNSLKVRVKKWSLEEK